MKQHIKDNERPTRETNETRRWKWPDRVCCCKLKSVVRITLEWVPQARRKQVENKKQKTFEAEG